MKSLQTKNEKISSYDMVILYMQTSIHFFVRKKMMIIQALLLRVCVLVLFSFKYVSASSSWGSLCTTKKEALYS